MSNAVEAEFLVAGGRLGTWWVPDAADLNDDGDLAPLPERREAGILTVAADGEWSLLLASEPPEWGVQTPDLSSAELTRRDLMWGKTRGSCTSLFTGSLTDDTTDMTTYAHEVWRGPWHVDSPGSWFEASDRVAHVFVEFAAGRPWADLAPGQGRKHNLLKQWDRSTGTFTHPDPTIHEATVAGVTVQLKTAVAVQCSDTRAEFDLGSHFHVVDELRIDEVLQKWVEPLHDLVGLFWLKNPGIVSVQVQEADSLELSKLIYSGRFAPVDRDRVLDAAHSSAPFATVEGLIARGYSFGDLLTGYWDSRSQGFGRSVQRLNESQDSHLDESLDARMLSATKSLEALQKAVTGQRGTVDLAKAAADLISATGAIGDDITDIWKERGPKLFKNSIAQIRHEYLAHEQSGERLKSLTDDDLTDHYWHHIALQWLLRRRLMETMGIAADDADHLVADSLAYKNDLHYMRSHYEHS